MRTTFLGILTLCALTALPQAQAARAGARTRAAAPEVELDGQLENWLKASGETTGWRLRTRADVNGRRRYVEVLLTAEIAQGVRAQVPVRVRGTMRTRHYAERGDVDVLVAKSVIEMPSTRR
jgi:hypothetical protein